MSGALMGVDGREPYPSDLSDEARALIRPVITSWKAKHPSVSGRESGYAMREIVNPLLQATTVLPRRSSMTRAPSRTATIRHERDQQAHECDAP
ncbi:hypothetical protein ACFZCU_43880 [Streptomyces canus]|uniref:hypothetical protein n=1 Tax=Streptomyces canus TaxID=58343 RepID=UPI0036F0A82A